MLSTAEYDSGQYLRREYCSVLDSSNDSHDSELQECALTRVMVVCAMCGRALLVYAPDRDDTDYDFSHLVLDPMVAVPRLRELLGGARGRMVG